VKPRTACIALFFLSLFIVGVGATSAAASGTGKVKFSVSATLGGWSKGAALSGSVKWTASASGATVSKVVFSIDGADKWTEQASPYQFNGDPNGVLDTKTLSNGAHTFAVRAYASDGRSVTDQLTAQVSNSSAPAFTVTSNVSNGATLASSVTWTASPSGATVSKVVFSIDGVDKWTEQISPYQFNGDPNGVLDTKTLSNGAHSLGIKAYATDGRTASLQMNVNVSNAVPTPPPAFTVSSNIANGATLSGSVKWTATPSGATATKITFSIDGSAKWSDTTAPFQFNGDPNGALDTQTLSAGSHALSVTASASDGRTASTSSTVNVQAAPAPSTGSIPRFGIATGYKILQRSAADQTLELNQIQSVGAKLVRFDSTPNNQSQVDTVVNGVLSRGMQPILILFGTTGPISPSTAASFAGSQAAKWKGRVRLYEFANEPDLNGWNGTNYAQALIAAYNAIKAADPNATVIAGALWKGAGGPVQFVTDMYNAGAKGHFDILSLHLYDDPFAAGSWNIWNMAFHMTPSVRSVMDAHGDTAIRIASTETGGPTTSYGEAGQATIIGHDFDALSDPRLAFICVYSMFDDVVTSQPGFGLLRPDRTQRPAWSVYKSRAT
jgi:hypothetical protein